MGRLNINEIFRSATFVLLLYITLVAATIRVSDTGSSLDTSFPGSYLVFGIFPFDITAELELLNDYDTCSPLSIDLTGKIAVINASTICKTTAVQDTLSARANNVRNAKAESSGKNPSNGFTHGSIIVYTPFNGVVFIIRDNELGRAYLTAGANYQFFDIAILLVSRDDGVKLSQLILQSNQSLIGQIVSESSPILDVGRSPEQIALTSICLLCDVAALVWVSVQLRLYFRKSTATISQIALILLLLSCIAMIIERILTIMFLFVHPFSMGPITGTLVLGIIFVIFAATFIALYWSSLVFPKKRKELKSVKIFVPLLCFFGACFVLYFVTVNLGESKIYSILEYIYVALLGLLACYFIVIGILLIRAMAGYDKAIQTKRVTRRLQVAMMLTGFSLICLLIVAVQTIQSTYSVNQVAFWTIRGLINIVTMATVAALAFLFRNPSSQPPSKSSHDQHSRNIDNSSTTIGGPNTPRGKEMNSLA